MTFFKFHNSLQKSAFYSIGICKVLGDFVWVFHSPSNGFRLHLSVYSEGNFPNCPRCILFSRKLALSLSCLSLEVLQPSQGIFHTMKNSNFPQERKRLKLTKIWYICDCCERQTQYFCNASFSFMPILSELSYLKFVCLSMDIHVVYKETITV